MLVRGVLLWGMSMNGVTYAVFALISVLTSRMPFLLWPVPVWIAGGLAWGVMTWHLSERRYGPFPPREPPT